MKQRDISIDILKFLAVLAITNSHMGLLYGKYSFLATGGAIGDALFFFCSGFTLFMGRGGRFDNWYKRRINRIYPTVFAWAILSSFIFGRRESMDSVVFYGGGWFVTCIMLYYVVLYFIRKWFITKIKWVISTVFIGCGLWFVLADISDDFNMYGATYFKWFHYFLFMLMGAMMGIGSPSMVKAKTVADVIMLVVSVVGFYALYYLMKVPELNKLHYFTLFPLAGVVYYFYRICNSATLLHLYNHKIFGWIIKFVGGLCLEIYLVQYSLFTDKMNGIFPLNIPIMFVIIVVVAYILRCASRIFAQTFKDMDYDWRAVVSYK